MRSLSKRAVPGAASITSLMAGLGSYRTYDWAAGRRPGAEMLE